MGRCWRLRKEVGSGFSLRAVASLDFVGPGGRGPSLWCFQGKLFLTADLQS